MKKNYISLLLIATIICSSKIVQAQDNTWLTLVTDSINLDSSYAGRIYVADINNDGYPDFLTVKASATMGVTDCIETFLNVQDTSSNDSFDRMFVNITDISGVNSTLNANDTSRGVLLIALADVNNDGNIDLVRGIYYHRLENYVDHGDRNEVLLGDGMGHFTVKPNNGLHELGLINSSGFSFLDYNKDGNIDLFIAKWFHDYQHDIWSCGTLMRGNGDGTFTDVSVTAGITDPEPMYGSCAVDWNNDGWTDIATAPYCRDGGQLWKNNQNGTFTNVAATVNYDAQYMGGDIQGGTARALCLWGSFPEDFDNDGDMDFFFCLIHGGNASNEGHSTIVMNGGVSTNYHLDWDINRITWNNPVSAEHGDYDASWLDLENDGLIDIVMTQGYYGGSVDRTFVFHQNQDSTFMDVTQAMGLIIPDLRPTHQLEALDYDLDGDDDVLICKQNGNKDIHFLQNNVGQNNNWTAVNLVAPTGVNYNCIDTKIVVYAGSLVKTRVVSAGKGNFSGQQPFSLIFGLGTHATIDSIKIIWPTTNNIVTTITNPPINQYISSELGVLNVPDVKVPTNAVDLKVYPNPTVDFILLQLTNNSSDFNNIEIYDLMGRKMNDFVAYNNSEATKYCSVKELSAGSYFVKITTVDGNVLTKRFEKIK